MNKVLLSLSYQVDCSIKRMHQYSFSGTVLYDEHGGKLFTRIVSIPAPICDGYEQECIDMLGVKLSPESVQAFLADYKSLAIDEIWLAIGYLGFMTVEVFCSLTEDIDSNTFSSHFEADIQRLADNVAKKNKLFDLVFEELSGYLVFGSDFYYGRHKSLDAALDRDEKYVKFPSLDRYIYTYHFFTDSNTVAKVIHDSFSIEQKPIRLGSASTWMRFGFHLWYVDGGLSPETMHKLSHCAIIAAWEVLIYDVGTINYNLFLQQIVRNGFADNEAIRESINHDNMLANEIAVLLRDQSAAELDKICQCREEYRFQYRKTYFENAQKSLLYATEGIETQNQSKSSNMLRVVLTILTAMSIYSVVMDGYSLLTTEAQVAPIGSISSLLFSFATLVMIIFTLIIVRKGD